MADLLKVSHSRMRCYKECKKKYFFGYVEGLRAVEKAAPLVIGGNYHQKIAEIIKDGGFTLSGDKVDAMAAAWMKYIKPHMEFDNKPERYYEVELGEGVLLSGYIDGTCTDGLQCEHKTCGAAIDEKYIYRLSWDDQIPTYLLGTNDAEMWYTVCQKPTIRQTQKETFEQYVERCHKWYDEDTERKIRAFKVYRNFDELEEKRLEIIQLAHEMRDCTFFPRNPSACSILGCEFEPICLNYDPRFDLTGFEKKPHDGREQEAEF